MMQKLLHHLQYFWTIICKKGREERYLDVKFMKKIISWEDHTKFQVQMLQQIPMCV